LGVGERTGRHWAKEGVDGTAVKPLRLVLKGELTLEQVERA
jgi:hypothetical protein